MSEGFDSGTERTTYTISCVEPDCDETWEFECVREEIARKVDAAIHWQENHEGAIPEDAPFGNEQCPKCLDILGMDGSASCSECGYIPEENRWKPRKEATA